jgi:hypothetical protein
MALSRGAAVVALSAAALLAGCSDSDGDSDAASTPAATPTASAAVAWAGEVCSASTGLQESVRSLGAVQVDPSSSSTSLDQARTQVRDGIAGVQEAGATLRAALAGEPGGADPELAAAQEQLQTASERATGSAEQLAQAAAGVSGAETPAQMTTALVTLRAALAGTANDLTAFLASLKSTVDGGGQALRDAFGSAPACDGVAT